MTGPTGRRRNGKSDLLDAEPAARAVQSGRATRTPKSRDAQIEMILSSAFVRASTMAPALRPVAANQPFTPVIETMRGLWMGHTSAGAPLAHEALLAVVYCAAILAVSAGH